jgi:lysophospholipase L1-like esterase
MRCFVRARVGGIVLASWALALAACSSASSPPAPREGIEPERPIAQAPRDVPPAVAPTEPEPPSDEPPPPTRRHYAVAAIGDSLTDARSGGGRYLDYLRQRCPESRFENFGVGGNMVNQMRRRFVSDVLPRADELTHVLVFGGVNDLYSDLTAGRTNDRIEADLAFMYGAARERGLRVIALTVAPWGGFTRHYNERRAGTTRALNDWIRGEHARGAIDHVVDAYALLSCGDPERLCPEHMRPFRDGLHFGARGHEVLGEALYRDVFSDCL